MKKKVEVSWLMFFLEHLRQQKQSIVAKFQGAAVQDIKVAKLRIVLGGCFRVSGVISWSFFCGGFDSQWRHHF